MNKKTHIIALTNHKGGAGKTTSTINLAAALGRAGVSVLIVDLDPQANASLHVGLKHPSQVDITSAEMLLSDIEKLPMAIHPETTLENVSLIYGGLQLGDAEDRLRDAAPRPNEELKSKLAVLEGLYEVILIDCPPSLKLLTSNALAAATEIIIPVESGSQYGLYGMSSLMHHTDKIRRINPDMRILGALLWRHDERQRMCQVIKNGAIKEVGKLIPVEISTSSKIARAALEKKSVHAVDRTAKVSREYRKLALWLIDELALEGRKEKLDAIREEVRAEEGAAKND